MSATVISFPTRRERVPAVSLPSEGRSAVLNLTVKLAELQALDPFNVRVVEVVIDELLRRSRARATR